MARSEYGAHIELLQQHEQRAREKAEWQRVLGASGAPRPVRARRRRSLLARIFKRR